MIPYRPPKPFDAIPVIDFAGAFSPELSARLRVARAVREACCEVGFFYLRNHGVPQGLLDAQLEWARRFFALPLAERMAVHTAKSRCLRGYEPVASQALDSGPADLRERFYMG